MDQDSTKKFLAKSLNGTVGARLCVNLAYAALWREKQEVPKHPLIVLRFGQKLVGSCTYAPG